MKNKLTAGFTLIELLVVIAIIGILSAVVLANLSSARSKGGDTAVKANLNNIRSQAELYYSNNSDAYAASTFAQATCPTTAAAGNLFSNDPNILKAINQAVAQGGNGSSCMATSNAWAAAVGMKTSGQSWCVDSTGNGKQYAGTPAAAITSNKCN